jgi:hypothetical protein
MRDGSDEGAGVSMLIVKQFGKLGKSGTTHFACPPPAEGVRSPRQPLHPSCPEKQGLA